MLFYFSFIMAFSLFGDKTFKKYHPYCQSSYKHIPQKAGFKFLKLIVVHRHGDRTPMKSYGHIEDECVDCNISKVVDVENLFKMSSCFREKCVDGALTVKGYRQMLKLGKFIKKNYSEKFDKITLNDISLRATGVRRTNTSLNGLVTGLLTEGAISDVIPEESLALQIEKLEKSKMKKTFGENFTFKIPSLKEETLVGYKTCPRLTHILTLPSKKGFAKVKNKKDIQIATDNYLYSICKDMNLDCSKTSCDLERSIDIVDGSFKTWTYQSILLNSHLNVRKFLFGRFANDLLLAFRDKKKLTILSAHDNSLSYILAGLGTQVIERPPLASAIFIEVWALNGVKYVRILFNNFICATNIDKSTNIPYEKMMKYIEAASASDEDLVEECNQI